MLGTRGIAGLLAAAIASGCTYWHTNPDALKGVVPERRALQVWSSGQSYDLNHVVVQGDSVHGSTNWTTFSCDTCVVALPLAAVDSVRTQKVSVGLVMLESLVVLTVLAYAAVGIALGGPGS